MLIAYFIIESISRLPDSNYSNPFLSVASRNYQVKSNAKWVEIGE